MVHIEENGEVIKVSGDYAELAADAGYILGQGIESLMLSEDVTDVSKYIEAFLTMLVLGEDNLIIKNQIELGAMRFIGTRLEGIGKGATS